MTGPNDRIILLFLLEHFFAADDVFTETNAFDSDKIKIGYGRLYRAWKRVRLELDPDFTKISHRYTQPMKAKLRSFNDTPKRSRPYVTISQNCSSVLPSLTATENRCLSHLIAVLYENFVAPKYAPFVRTE